MIENDPRMNNYGVPNRGQLVPNRTAANMQSSLVRNAPQTGPTGFGQQNQSPMQAGIQQAPNRPAPPPPQSGMNKAATGTFGPKTNPFQGLKNRGATDFSKGLSWNPHKAGSNLLNAVGSGVNKGPSWMTPLGIGRRAAGSQNDYSVDNAKTALQRGYQNSLGRDASEEELMGQLGNQGLKPGDRWVGKSGLDSLLASLGQSEEGQAYAGRQAPPEATELAGIQPEAPVASAGNRVESPLLSGLQAPSVERNSGAQSAYQEYVSEFSPDEEEQPLDFETFSNFYNQMPQEEEEAPSAIGAGWEGLNLGMLEGQGSGMAMNGFNMERASAGGDANSVKDAFGRAASTFPVDLRGKSKEEVGAVLASPEFMSHLAKQGIQARPIPGSYDQIEVKTAEEGWVVKDVVSAAGSPDAAWWWGDVGGAGMDPMMGDEFSMYGEESSEDGSAEQSSLLNGLTGGSNWKTLLEQLMSQYSKG